MAEIRLELRTERLVDATGLIRGLRVRCDSKWTNLAIWLWLDRESGQVAELRPYRVALPMRRVNT